MAASDDAAEAPSASPPPPPPPPPPPSQQEQQQHMAKKAPGTWSHIETLHLIEAYRDKWYALKRGQLRTSHWDEVAESLACLCAGHPDSTGKSSVQCRHKLEKLRRRYRAERQLVLRKGPGASRWPYFEQMDRLERGAEASLPAPPTKLALSFVDLQKRHAPAKDDHDSGMSLDDEGEDSDQPPPKPSSFPHHHRKRPRHYHAPPPPHHRHHDDNDGSYSPAFNRKQDAPPPPPSYSSKDDYRFFAAADGGDSGPSSELVSVIRYLGEGFLRMEQMKIQMQRETELFRADMELRRTEMVLEAQKQIALDLSMALDSTRRTKKLQSHED